MKRIYLLLAVAVITAAALGPEQAEAGVGNRRAERHMNESAWHGQYYHTQYGRPLALVVPPTASMQTRWGWGVGSTEVVPIWHQYGRAYPGDSYGGAGAFYPTPAWPGHTDQFGVYYIRGPW